MSENCKSHILQDSAILKYFCPAEQEEKSVRNFRTFIVTMSFLLEVIFGPFLLYNGKLYCFQMR